MEENNYSPIKLEGGAFYKDIVSISFNPIEVRRKLEPSIHKGKLYFWKLLGFIPLIPLVAKEDLYEPSNNPFYRFTSLKKLYQNHFEHSWTFLDGNTIYKKASVDVDCIHKNLGFIKYFVKNEDATNYLEDLKNKCIAVGNILK